MYKEGKYKSIYEHYRVIQPYMQRKHPAQTRPQRVNNTVYIHVQPKALVSMSKWDEASYAAINSQAGGGTICENCNKKHVVWVDDLSPRVGVTICTREDILCRKPSRG